MFSYHNHTTFSDGSHTCEEMILSAIDHNLDEFGVSDHFAIWYDGTVPEWSINDFGDYTKELLSLKEKYTDKISVKIGVELENLPSMLNKESEEINKYPLDYIIGGLHFVDDWDVGIYGVWDKFTEDEKDKNIIKFWKNQYYMCKYGDIDIVAHFDTYERWGALNDKDYSEYLIECLKVCKERGLVTEINTIKKKPKINQYIPHIVEEFYPREDFIKIIADYDIPVIISTDAHNTGYIDYYVEDAKALFRKYNIRRTARFENRKAIIENVDF
ncbi:MAG: histidinol-phosphatase HisJ family protein [Abditibacteriota bacterium]|nr:histidinol-phosphatase HisJ family protein [Abditibacteriota bacterium]